MRVPSTLHSGFDSLPTIHDVADDDRPISPERALWLSVVALCWADAFGVTPDHQIRHADSRFRRDEATMKDDNDSAITVEAYRAQCRNWLIQDFGDWKADRELCCDLAGIDPDMLRNAAKAKRESTKAGEKPTAEIVNLDSMFARLLDQADGMAPEELDAALAELAKLEAAA